MVRNLLWDIRLLISSVLMRRTSCHYQNCRGRNVLTWWPNNSLLFSISNNFASVCSVFYCYFIVSYTRKISEWELMKDQFQGNKLRHLTEKIFHMQEHWLWYLPIVSNRPMERSRVPQSGSVAGLARPRQPFAVSVCKCTFFRCVSPFSCFGVDEASYSKGTIEIFTISLFHSNSGLLNKHIIRLPFIFNY